MKRILILSLLLTTSAFSTTLPKQFDWRWHLKSLNNVKHQKCGDSVAMGITSQLEAVIEKRDGLVLDLAEQTLLSDCEKGVSCGGGSLTPVYDFLMSHGLPHEEFDPYQGKDSACINHLEHVKYKISNWAYLNEGAEPSVEQIKKAVHHYGPLLTTYKAVSAYKGGVFNACTSGGANHVALIIGWDDATESWIATNSWGKNWGEGGFFRIRWLTATGKKCNEFGKLVSYILY